jgi:hypothetical protein
VSARSLAHRVAAALFMPAVVLALPVNAHAQSDVRPTAPVEHRQIISANPFGLMFEWFNAEYERRLGPTTTWGVSTSWFSLDHGDFDYVNGNALFRYYPQGHALRGFFLGGRGGVFHVSDDREGDVFYGAGFEIGYDWLLGARQNVGISLGAGATRLFGGQLRGASLTVPTVRLLNVGIAF